MDIRFRCLECGAKYIFENSNSRIYGPVIHTKCPLCERKTRMNLSKFIGLQIDIARLNRYEIIKKITVFARELEKKIKC